ncbi:MAG: hypothetical protein AAFZ65_07140 [Planctomycetota bacterium]
MKVGFLAVGLIALVAGPSPGTPTPGTSAKTPPSCLPLARAGAVADPVRLLETWSRLDTRRLAKVDRVLLDETLDALVAPDYGVERERRDLALCAFLGRLSALDATPDERLLAAPVLATLQRLHAAEQTEDLEAYLIEHFALMSESVPIEARIGACEALVDGRHPRIVPTMTLLSRSPAPSLAAAASGVLVGRIDRNASSALLEAALAAAPDQRALQERLLMRHLEALDRGNRLDDAWSDALGTKLGDHVLARSLDTRWRVAVPAVRLSKYVPAMRACAVLTEALAAWTERDAAHDTFGARRMRHECADTLAKLTGRDLGIDPMHWRRFWSGVRSGAPLAVDGEDDAFTTASFFGLELRSNAVAFVIDASGSMATEMRDPEERWGSASSRATRYEVACAELLRTLRESPKPMQFRVVLFNNRGRAMQSRAETVSDHSLQRANQWLRRQDPDGGTHLATGLARLLDPEDDDSLEDLDVDTVVVLCDGATHESAAWANAWLSRWNADAPLVIHAVQIGGHRAAAIARLSEATGGDFVRLDR